MHEALKGSLFVKLYKGCVYYVDFSFEIPKQNEYI